nr:FadR/GntR family transcriptional regulator [uncultured Gellertiella sp.]
MTEPDLALFPPVSHGRTADEVVRQVELLILEGVLRDGDRLPGERELAARFDVSRPILRDALKELEARGLLESRHGGGTYVADIIGQVFSAPVAALVSRHERATLDYLDYRRELEGLTAELAASRATEADKALLSSIIADMRRAHARGDFEDETTADLDLHNAIGEAAHNIILLHTVRACYRLLEAGIFRHRKLVFDMPGARERLLEQHVAIHDAILAGDPARARQAAINHIDFVIDTNEAASRSGDRNRVAQLRLLQRTEKTQRSARNARPSNPAARTDTP